MKSRRYYPDLIPTQHRVLGDYFRGSLYPPVQENKFEYIFVFSGLSLIIAAFFALHYLPFGISLFISGLILLPGVGKKIATLFDLRVTRTVRTSVLATLLLVNVPLSITFGRILTEVAARERVAAAIELKAQQEAEVQEEQRKDSLSRCLALIDSLKNIKQADKALIALDKADLFSKTSGETSDVDRKRIEVSLLKAESLIEKNQFSMAIELLNSVEKLDRENVALLYLRAVSYMKTGDMESAARDSKAAMLKGYPGSAELYEKVNPVKKRFLHYTTLCRDGSFSGASGRGACSHHGGVESRKYPVYATYRQYD